MSRATINFLLDTLLLIAFLLLLWCSVVLQFVFPPGPSAAGWTLWRWDVTQWASFQFGLVAVLAFGFLVHVMLHWTWVCGFVAHRIGRLQGTPDDGTRTIYGVALLIVLFHIVGFGIAAASLSIRAP